MGEITEFLTNKIRRKNSRLCVVAVSLSIPIFKDNLCTQGGKTKFSCQSSIDTNIQIRYQESWLTMHCTKHYRLELLFSDFICGEEFHNVIYTKINKRKLNEIFLFFFLQNRVLYFLWIFFRIQFYKCLILKLLSFFFICISFKYSYWIYYSNHKHLWVLT